MEKIETKLRIIIVRFNIMEILYVISLLMFETKHYNKKIKTECEINIIKKLYITPISFSKRG